MARDRALHGFGAASGPGMVTSMDQIDLSHLRSWIGREASAADVVTPELVRRFRSTFDLPIARNPIRR